MAAATAGKIALGGGGGLIVVVLALLFGINPGDILGGQPAGPEQTSGSSPFAQCTRGADISKDRNCRFVAYTNSIQDYWKDTLQDYQVIKVETFTGSIDTACGNATSAVGPFYCPGDTSVYLDLEFFDQLTGQLGAEGGDAAEAYVLAHEFGHHIQNLTGTMREVQGSGQGTAPSRPRSDWSCRPTATPGCGSSTRPRTRRARSPRSVRMILIGRSMRQPRSATTGSRRRPRAR